MINIGSTDRLLRLVVGIVLLAIGLLPMLGHPLIAGLGGWAWAVAAVGAVMVLTALFRFCPAYTLIGMNTCRK